MVRLELVDGTWREIRRYSDCPNGHLLDPPNVRVSWRPCVCAGGTGHRVYRCETCAAQRYDPPHIDDCGRLIPVW